MELIGEYQRQQRWRNWPAYLAKLPIAATDRVLDLGCSVGGFADAAATRCAEVLGVDVNTAFIEHCRAKAAPNQRFECVDIAKLDLDLMPSFQGVWSSFSMSYLADPQDLLAQLHRRLEPGGWIALVDVSCFLSGNLPPRSEFLALVQGFEKASAQRGYDFDFGAKMRPMLEGVGFSICFEDQDVTDPELNFDGAATPEVLAGWQARLARMQGLRRAFPGTHELIEAELLAHIGDPSHAKRGNVRFVVGRKA